MRKEIITGLIIGMALGPSLALASPVISEIMYDLEGTDTGREWVEISNSGTEAVNLADWKFFEAETNHKLTFVRGSESLAVGGFAVITDDSQKFLVDWPNFSGTIFDSTFSLSNTGETLVLRSSDLVDVDIATYSNGLGGAGDGKSLQKSGSVWIPSLPTPGVTQLTANSDNNGGQNNNASTTPPAPASNSVGSRRIEPTIYADAGEDRTVAAGSVGLFTAQAVGLKNEPLEASRYFWVFGDGASAEGKKVFHAYSSPGTYLAVLEITSGEYSASARVKVLVVPAMLSILNVSSGERGGVTLKNESGYELDLSWWQLVSGPNKFVFPKNTIVLPKATVVFPASITGLLDINQGVSLFYPNGELASRFSHEAVVSRPAVSETVPIVSEVKKSAVSIPSAKEVVKSEKTNVLAQTASADSAFEQFQQTEKNKFPWLWLWGVLGLALVAVLGVWYSSRAFSNQAVGPDTGGVSPNEFDLIEE